jgi:hypothetical protein
MADRKISDLTESPNPGADTGFVPIIEAATVGGVTTYSQYRASVRNVVGSGMAAGAASLDTLSDVVAPSPVANDVLSYQSGAWRPRSDADLVDGGNF